MKRFATGLGALALFVGSCGQTPDDGFVGPDVTIEVAPLTLPGIQDVCYSLAVFNADATGQAFGEPAANLVWEKADLVNGALCSTRYGDGAGSLSFVGTCDASAGTGWIQLSLDTMTANVSGSPTPLIEGQTVANGFINPCPDTAPCVLSAPCDENADTPVEFNLTVMRAANQGFFDIAVSFEDIFCSAKLDCGAVGEDRDFLYNASGERDMTVILAVSCTGGPDEAEPTHLYMNDVYLTCTGAGHGATIDASSGPGNVTPATNDGGILFGAAVYRGDEDLAGAAYWNVALGLNEPAFADAGDCTITTRVTASAEAFTDNATPAGTSWPVIDVDVLAISGGARVCTYNPLNGAGSGVTTEYTPIDTAGEAFDHGYVYGDAGLIVACPADLVIEGNLILSSPADLPADYQCLTEITNLLVIQNDGSYGDLSFDRLHTIGGSLIVPSLSTGSVDLSFPALTSVGDYIDISGSAVTSASFGALQTLPGSLKLQNTTDATLAAPVLTTSGGLEVNSNTNPALQVPALTTIDGTLAFQGNSGVSTFGLPLVESTGYITVQVNTGLTALDWPSLVTVSGTFRVTNNTALSTCAIQAIVDGLTPTPTTDIAGNLDDAAFCPACSSYVVYSGNLDIGSPAELPADYGCITEITGGLTFYEDTGVGTVVFANLETIGADLLVDQLETGTADLYFPALASIGTEVRIGGGPTPALGTLSLPSLQTAPSGMHVDSTTDAIIDAPQLTSAGQLEVTGNTNLDLRLGGLQSLTGQLVFVVNPGLTELALPELVSIAGQVYVQGNTDATSLSLGKLRTVSGPRLEFNGNSNLPTCAIQAVVDALTTAPGVITITGNDDTATCP